MKFHGKDILNWSINDYLRRNHPEVRKADADAAFRIWRCIFNGCARMMSGHTLS
jgi:glycine C-acetyltransferase